MAYSPAPAPLGRRLLSAVVDFVVWTTIWLPGIWLISDIGHLALGVPSEWESADTITLVSVGLGTLLANAYLAVSNGLGQSVGKAVTGLRLIVSDDGSAVPGLARGVVRSSLQAGPYMGALMVVTGLHDRFARTRIVTGARVPDPEPERAGTATARVPGPPTSTIVVAVGLHLFFAFVFMVVAVL